MDQPNGLPPCVAAEWLEERGRYIAADWMMSDGILPPHASSPAVWDGNGNGSGYGVGHAAGYGGGQGYGYGSGDGAGDIAGVGAMYDHMYDEIFRVGSGLGTGTVAGAGDGLGDGSGDGEWRSPRTGIIPTTNMVLKAHINKGGEIMPKTGDYVIVRAKDSGLTFGEYQWHSGREVCLREARTIWSWAGGRLCVMDVAVRVGPVRLSAVVDEEVIILDACQIIPVSPEVENHLRTAPPDRTN